MALWRYVGSVIRRIELSFNTSLTMKILIVGYNEPGQMGNYLAAAAESLGVEHRIIDANAAEASNRIVQALYWRFGDRKPRYLHNFGATVVQTCTDFKPNVVITTGVRAPLDRVHLFQLSQLGIKILNYSTDDPWNPVLHASWFISTLPLYDAIFTPRRSNIREFRSCGARAIHYLPFGYDPTVHRPLPATEKEPAWDVLFVGGCDEERLPFIAALAKAGLKLSLFGRYWDRNPRTREFWRGVADQGTIRAASADSRLSVCLVRRANRDGHVMRSYEAAAVGGCILAEDTADHRELFGPHDHAVRYFKTIPQLVDQAKILATDPELRNRLAAQLRKRMNNRTDTYADRLKTMLQLVDLRTKRAPADRVII